MNPAKIVTGGSDARQRTGDQFSFAVQDSGFLGWMQGGCLDAPCDMAAGSHVGEEIPTWGIQVAQQATATRGDA